MDCVLIQDSKAHQLWPNISKVQLCYRVHDGETEPRAVMPPAVIDQIVEVASGSVGVGATWDGAAFANPASEPAPRRFVPYAEFRGRFTDIEREALFNSPDWRIRDLVALASSQGSVDLESTTTTGAKQLLVALGIFSAQRVDTVFAP